MFSPAIISLGGSIVIPDAIDTVFIKSFRELILKHVSAGERFIITVGGGKVCRRYQEASKELGTPSQEELDWIGIRALMLNAQLIRSIFGEVAHGTVIIEPSELHSATTPVVIFGAKAPGHSTDFDAVEAAHETGAKRVINLSNIDYAYDKDPREFPDAKKIEKTNWKEFRNILPAEWSPGVNAPFDPVAAKRAEELGLEVAIMNGKNLLNLEHYLSGGEFKGTVIR
ncbi:MAG: UMP kinase [bacterium]|nr:UMP kinase [bacterium]